MVRHIVTLVFRRPRDTANFSIETSFDRMMACFPRESPFELRRFTSRFLSNGLMRRLKGIREARRFRGEVNHVTGDVHYLVFAFPRETVVLTVHDCGFMRHPNRIARKLLKWLWLDLPVRYCRYVTAVSEATRSDIIRYTGCDPEKVVVIPTVISDAFRAVPREFNSRPRILHVGLAPNKNFERHVEAISGLPCGFHIVGRLDQSHLEMLGRNGIDFTHEYNITEEKMVRAYAESDMLLFASTLEGFGMPILEAQSVGRPVITSNVTPMCDVAGDGALLVDPYDPAAIRLAVVRLMEEPPLCDELVEKGFMNAVRFSVPAVARCYEELYRRIIATRS
jgi:glycosyltransferase involved in cell wall biosynthesis